MKLQRSYGVERVIPDVRPSKIRTSALQAVVSANESATKSATGLQAGRRAVEGKNSSVDQREGARVSDRVADQAPRRR